MMKHLLFLFALSIATAAKGQGYLPPYVENFEDSYLPGDWTEFNSVEEAQHWQFTTTSEFEFWGWPQFPGLDGRYALIHQDYYESVVRQDAQLISPTFDFTNVGPVRLFFNHSFAVGDFTTATLSYRSEYGSWITIKTWTASTPNPDTYNELIPEVAGKAEVQFKWSLSGFYSGYWAIDNVTISEPGLTATWAGWESDNWHNPMNWDEGFVPNALCDVVIPAAEYDIPVIQEGSAICKNITIEAGAYLEIFLGYSLTVLENLSYEDEESIILDSGIESSASLIAGSVSGTGSAFIARNMSQNRWFYVGSPVSQSISSFLNDNPSIPTKDNSRGMMDFNTSSNDWNPFFDNSTSGNFVSGKGYAMRLSQYGGFAFSGPISAGTISNPLSTEGLGWNLVGNPYTSGIALNDLAAESNFLGINQDALDPSFVSVYLWDGTQYEIINNMTTNWQIYASMGQGFFVKANPGGGNLTFNRQMQVHRPAVQLKSGKIIPGIKLQVSSTEKTASTDIKFAPNATTGLDVGYDAGILKADPGFTVFTKLVQDNNVEFALQCLPEPNSEIMAIPVGVDFREGGEITFTAEVVDLPDESSVVLEDKLMNVFTTFDKATSKYSTTTAANAESIGRFYLHVSGNSQVTAIDSEANLKNINAWLERNEIVISGISENNAVAVLFDLQGRSLMTRNLEGTPVNRINVTGITPGVYMLQVIENRKRTGIKLRLAHE